MTSVFPNAAVRASRDEVHQVPLVMVDGALPAGLAGHVFILSTCGSVDSNGAPYPNHNDRPTVINGDGMVWRVDLAPAGGGPPTISSAIVKPPDYYWDVLTRNGSPLELFGFMDAGMLRASFFLGTRNFGNTAFVPMPPRPPAPGSPASEAAPARLLVCYDAGPPVELDPVTLETTAVIGRNWDPEALDGMVPFPPILATAHPFFDPATQELFGVNYGRSGLSMVETIPLFEAVAFLPEMALDVVRKIAAIFGKTPECIARLVRPPVKKLFDFKDDYKGRKESAAPQSFLDLVRWTGQGDIERYPVIDVATGQLAGVDESMHQVAVTRRYILLLDTNFKLRFDQMYDNPLFDMGEVERLIRTFVSSQQGHISNLWVIERAEVERARRGDGARAVPAFKVPVPGSVHFLADYDDSDGIRIQCAHGNALDIAEWVRSDDFQLDGRKVRQDLIGLTTSPVDVSQIGQYVIDPAARRLTQSQQLSDDALWGIALYAGRGVPVWDAPPERLKYAYWFACGLWPENYTQFMRGLYADLPGRIIPLEEVDRLVAQGGMPPALVCVDLDGFAIADRYVFDESMTLSSPQFIPDPARAGDDRGGWISTVVWTADHAWLWLFDAANLGQGPIARMQVPVTLGFSLHTAWLPRIAPIPAARAAEGAPKFDWKAELRARVGRLRPKAQKRLKRVVDAVD